MSCVPRSKLHELEKKLNAINVPIKGWRTKKPAHLACQAHLYPGAYFDVDEVVKKVWALTLFSHMKGRWRGQPLTPAPWQVMWIIAPIFGWKRPDGTRVIREAWIEVPRKNGKSTISSGIANLMLVADGEGGAEVYAAATSEEQARIVFNASKSMMATATPLKGKVRLLAKKIEVPKTESFFKALTKAADAAQGLNVHAGIIDEIHVHKDRELIEVIETGTGARTQPLIIYITTADEGEEFSIYAEKHDLIIQLAAGTAQDTSTFGVIWCATLKDNPFSPKTWAKANPNYPESPTHEYLEDQARKAKNTPARLANFLRLHLNVRTPSTTQAFNIRIWDKNTSDLNRTKLYKSFKGRAAYAGLDLSSTQDLSAFSIVSENPDNPSQLDSFTRFWLPADSIDDLELRLKVPLSTWIEQGYITVCEGPTIDYDQIEEQVIFDCEYIGVKRLSYDRMFAGQLTQNVEKAVKNLEVVPVSQTFMGLSPAWKMMKKLVAEKNFNHYQDPVLRWHAVCVEEKDDGNDNQRPHRPDRLKSSKRIDGIAANVMAIDGYIRRPIEVQRKVIVSNGRSNRRRSPRRYARR